MEHDSADIDYNSSSSSLSKAGLGEGSGSWAQGENVLLRYQRVIVASEEVRRFPALTGILYIRKASQPLRILSSTSAPPCNIEAFQDHFRGNVAHKFEL